MASIRETRQHSEYDALSRESTILGETNDCAVKALAIAANIHYREAHAALAKRGRRTGGSTNFYTMTLPALHSFGKDLREIDKREIIARYPAADQCLRSVTSHHPRRFRRAWQQFARGKTLLMRTNRHILAIVDCEVIDWSVNNALRAVAVYEVVDKEPEADKPEEPEAPVQKLEPASAIDKDLVMVLEREINLAMAAIAERHGLGLTSQGIRYNSRTAIPRFELAVLAETGQVMSREAQLFLAMAPRLGLRADDLGREFTTHSGRYRIVGANPKAKKYPVVAEEVGSGKRYKFPAISVKIGLGRPV